MIKVTLINTRSSLINVKKLNVKLAGNKKLVKDFEHDVLHNALDELDLLKKKGLLDYRIEKNEYDDNQFDTAIPVFTTVERNANRGKYRIVYDKDSNEYFCWRDDLKDYTIMGSGTVTEHVHLNAINGGEFGSGGHVGLVQRVVQTRDPSNKDDAADTFKIGVKILKSALWLNSITKTVFVCVDNTIKNAVWVNVFGDGDLQQSVWVSGKQASHKIVVGDVSHRYFVIECAADFKEEFESATIKILQRNKKVTCEYSKMQSNADFDGLGFFAHIINNNVVLEIFNSTREPVLFTYTVRRVSEPTVKE